MEVETIRSEFLRLADAYPEMRHAVVQGDENWRKVCTPPDLMRLFGFETVAIVSDYGLNDDRFARVYCLWLGADDSKHQEAEAEFHRLAQIAESSIQLQSLESKGGPVQLRASCCDFLVPKPTERLVKVGIPQVSVPRINRWICHTIISNGVRRRPCEIRSDVVIGRCQLLLLPFNSFRASAIALQVSVQNGTRDPLDCWIYSRWQYEADKTGTQIFADYEKIRAKNSWPKVADWDALRKRAERYARAYDLPLRKGAGGRPKKNG